MGIILDEWKRQHFAQVRAHGISRAALESAARAFFAFLQLPEELKAPIRQTIPGEDRTTRGYTRRRAKDDSDQEEKMYFHYHPEVEVSFQKEIAAAGEPAETFMRVAHDMWEKTLAIGEDAIREFEERWPGTRVRFMPPGESPLLVIRFLAYLSHPHGDFLAKPHYDRGTFTIALGESAPGLRIGTPECLVEVAHRDGFSVVMPGTGFQADIDSGIEPAWHDVVQKKDVRFSETTARWAIVGFFDVKNRSYISIEDTHVPRTRDR